MKKTVTKEKPFLKSLTLGGGAALLLLFFSIVYLLPPAAGALVQGYLSKATGLPVKVSKIHLSLARSQFSIKGLEFSNAKGFPDAPLARIGKAKIHYLLPATIGGWFGLKKVEINFDEFRLVRNEAGTLNLPAIRPLPARGETIDELVLNLGSVTYTDLSSGQPVQQTFDVKLEKAVYRKVKGIPGIFEILNWEILKRTGVEEKKTPPLPEIKLQDEPQPFSPSAAAPSSSGPLTSEKPPEAGK